jgi:hypothetical protein
VKFALINNSANNISREIIKEETPHGLVLSAYFFLEGA